MNFDNVLKEGFTFDDVLLIPAYSEVLPGEVSTNTSFSKNIQLSIPIVSAAMDTISESAMAIGLAREGGISVIHKNMTIEEQAQQVVSVKRSESGVILNPITLGKNATALEAKKLMIDNNIGIVAQRDIATEFSQETLKSINPLGGHNYWLADNNIIKNGVFRNL